jgi:murein L,D-transpeptidase YcbB/YkuD
VEEDGTVEFRPDVYGADAKLIQALAKEPLVALDFDNLKGQVRAAL